MTTVSQQPRTGKLIPVLGTRLRHTSALTLALFFINCAQLQVILWACSLD